MHIPKISIVTVVYNAKTEIEQTIVSVLNLHYLNLEYIIIDGGSTDGTIDIIKKYEDKITYWISEPDEGIYDAMNKGWAYADNNSYLLFLGAGDKIIKLPRMDLHPGADLIYGDVAIGENRLFKSSVSLKSILANTIHHQAMLVKKAVHSDPPFSLEYKIYADFDFNQRLIKAGIQFDKDNDFLAYAMEGGASASINNKEYLTIVRKNYGWLLSYLAFFYYKLQYFNEFRKNNRRHRSV